MKSITSFVITTNSRYKNEVDVDGGKLVVNTEVSERDYHFVNREATVLAVPLAIHTEVKPGDKLIVHHNIFRRWVDMRGNERNSGDYIDEDIYCARLDQVYAYNDGTGWKPFNGYTFVAPIIDKNNAWDTSNELTHVGTMVYGPEELQGLTVGFTPNSEYEFNIDGQKLYRIYLNDIVWTSKKNAKELLKAPEQLLTN